MNTIITSVVFLSMLFNLEQPKSTILSEDEKDGILLMREEEKLAHDVYSHFADQWEIPVFKNITRSEFKHFEAIGYLLEEFELDDPASNKAGYFKNTELKHLYDSLTASGTQNIINALKAGAFIEELDIQDLQQLIKASDNDTIITVYENLLRASGNHLLAFTRQLSFRDINYAPSVLSVEEFDTILDSPQEGGKKMGNCMIQPNTENKQRGKMRRKRGGFND
jgi:hypothetical protein